jgi:tetratricopeptide (TPR) repeat protein
MATWTRSLLAAIKQHGPRPVPAVPIGHVILFLLLVLTAHLPLVSAREAASVTYNNFAIQALLRGEHDLTELFVSRSIELNPEFSLAFNTRGVMHRERGDAVRAIADFENAIAISPDYETARQNLNRIVNSDEHDAVKSGGAQ